MSAPLNTSANGQDPQDLAGEYVLGTLSHADRLKVEAALAHDSTLRAAVRAWELRLLPLTSVVEPVAPPAALWQRIERSITPSTAPAQDVGPAAAIVTWWNNLSLWRGLAAGGMAAAAILAVVLAPRLQLAPESKLMVVLAAPQSAKPGWVIQTSDASHLRLVPLGVTEVPADKSLQFWTKGDGWKGPVSLGLVEPGKPLEVSMDKLPNMQPNQLFEITLEPKNGSPIGRPTGPILFIGRAVVI